MISTSTGCLRRLQPPSNPKSRLPKRSLTNASLKHLAINKITSVKEKNTRNLFVKKQEKSTSNQRDKRKWEQVSPNPKAKPRCKPSNNSKWTNKLLNKKQWVSNKMFPKANCRTSELRQHFHSAARCHLKSSSGRPSASYSREKTSVVWSNWFTWKMCWWCSSLASASAASCLSKRILPSSKLSMQT